MLATSDTTVNIKQQLSMIMDESNSNFSWESYSRLFKHEIMNVAFGFTFLQKF